MTTLQRTQQLQSISQELVNLQLKVQSLLVQEKKGAQTDTWKKTAGSLSKDKADKMLTYIQQSRSNSEQRLQKINMGA